MTIYTVKTFLTVLFFALCTSCIFANDKNNFLNDYSPKEVIDNDISKTCYTFDMCLTDYNKNNYKKITKTKCGLNNIGYFIQEITKYTEQNGKKTFYENSVELSNDKYYAMLEKNSKNKYVLNNLSMHENGKTKDLCIALASYYELLTDRSFKELVADDNTQVILYSDSNFNNLPCKILKVKFTYRINSKIIVEPVNEYFFLPEKNWVCIAAKIRTQSNIDENIYEEYRMSFTSNSNNIVIPDKIEIFDVKNGDLKLTRSYEITDIKKGNVSDINNSISNFGIPEFSNMIYNKKSNTIYYYVFSIIILFFLITIIYFVFFRKNQK